MPPLSAVGISGLQAGEDVKPLYIDCETHSSEPIRNGVYRYSEADDFEVLLLTWALGDGPANLVDLNAGEPLPPDLLDALLDDDVELVAHNAQFDRVALRAGRVLDVPLERWRCTMAQAYAHSLPGSLADLCALLRVDADDAKDADGKRLVRLFTQPLPKNSTLRRATRHTHPDDWERFRRYAQSDIRALRAIDQRLPRWNYSRATDVGRRELALWHLDQRINDRGIPMDVALIDATTRAVAEAKRRANDGVASATGGVVESAGQRDKLLAFLLAEHGVDLPDLRKDTIERRVADPNLPAGLRDLLTMRLDGANASSAKFKRMQQMVCRDGRIRGTLQFCGAKRTGRWAGRGVQFQNLARNTMEQADIDRGIELLLAGAAEDLYD